MRKVKLIEYLSLDGVMQDPGGTGTLKHRGWTMPYWNEELMQMQSEELFASDALLLGRVTYEEFAAAWPQRSGDPFTDKMNAMRKFVATRDAKRTLGWNATPLAGDVCEAVERLKSEPGQDILMYGSATLASMLMDCGLIDWYRFIVYPVVLGEGRRFFHEDVERRDLDLVSASTTKKGVNVLTFRNAAR